MADSIVPADRKLLALLAGGTAPLPFGREIVLLECHVAGTSHVDLTGVWQALHPDARLPLRREPDNPYDPFAVRVEDGEGHKLGYLPRDRNEAVARLMDAGKRIEARLEGREWCGHEGRWLKLDVSVLLIEL